MQKTSLVIVLDDIRSALNVGAIFRTADAVGAKELILCGITPYPPHPRIPKTALGATESVAWKHWPNKTEAIQHLKEQGYNIIAVEKTEKAQDLYKYKFPENTALIFGNEINGVSTDIIEKAESVLQIPMLGIKESLNVATTVGIVSYEYIRQQNYQ
ncbi:MAG TPA: RNA methyltransferase [Candidatus Dojkabacteria bacterium]|jgi:tRNA G18 (ribose-2'-O)-methylase SpoU|nr:RNA methyltransferase [Candidatus Dojkabacteria bacterium]